ncbi:MAG: DUF21 domain-containing protein [Planctomycetes bacterium]|nr:DUF21 domain-containing protein [Planctomycetota bacterium]
MTLFFIILLILGLGLSAFFSGSESGLYFLSEQRLSVLSSQGKKGAAQLLKILKSPGEMIITMLIGNNIALQFSTFVTLIIWQRLGLDHPWLPAEVATTVVLFLPFFLFGEVIPKATYRLHPERILLRTYPLLNGVRVLFAPLSFLFNKMSRLLEHLFGADKEEDLVFDRQNLSHNLGHAYAGGVLSEDQMDLLSTAIQAGELRVEQVMTPLRNAEMLPLNASREMIADIFKNSSHHIFPVYEGKRTKIVGTVDLRKYALSQAQNQEDLEEMLGPLHFIKKGEPFSYIFKAFFEENAPMVFVLSGKKIIGCIIWEEAMLKLLR